MTNVIPLFPKRCTYDAALRAQKRKRKGARSRSVPPVDANSSAANFFLLDDELASRRNESDALLTAKAIGLAEPGSSTMAFVLSVEHWRITRGRITPKQRQAVINTINELEAAAL